MAQYKITNVSGGSYRDPMHFEPDAIWSATTDLNVAQTSQQVAVASKGTTEQVSVIDLDGKYAEFGHLIDLGKKKDGWSASSFVNLTKALSGGIEQASSFLSVVTSVTNGYISNEKTMAMFIASQNLKSFDANMPRLIDGSNMFYGCIALTSFTSDISRMTTGNMMFTQCVSLSNFNVPLNNLYKADNMFAGTRISSWTVALPKLWNGTRMFSGTPLTSWSVALPELENANHMFSSTKLTDWTMDLLKVKQAGCTFDNCTSLTTFNASLPKAESVTSMFYKCSELTNVEINIPSIIQDAPTGDTKPYEKVTNKGTYDMFSGCKALTSATITTNTSVQQYLTPKLLTLPTDNWTWDIQITNLGDGLIKAVCTRSDK